MNYGENTAKNACNRCNLVLKESKTNYFYINS